MVKPTPPLCPTKSEATSDSAKILPTAGELTQYDHWKRSHDQVLKEMRSYNESLQMHDLSRQLERHERERGDFRNLQRQFPTYTHVSYFFYSMSIVDNWMADNCRCNYCRLGSDFLFESTSDASKFIMFWKVRMIEHLNKFIPE